MTRKQIETLAEISKAAYPNSPLMPLDVEHGSDLNSGFADSLLHVKAKDDRGYPDGNYEAEWLIDEDGGRVQIVG